MEILDKLEFHLATEEAIQGMMTLIEQEMRISPAVMKKTAFRFQSFMEKAKDMGKLTAMINLRTKKMTHIDKLIAWFRVLENENFHTEAAMAISRLRALGYEGAV